MRLLVGIILLCGGICGAVIGLLSSIVVNSSLPIIDGLELSIGLTLFSIVTFIGGLYNLFSTG